MSTLFRVLQQEQHSLLIISNSFDTESSKHVSAEAAKAKVEADLARVVELYETLKIKVDDLEKALRKAVELRCKDFASYQE